MPYKEFALDASTKVKIYKRKSSRSLRLTVAPGGQIRVSIPSWAPYQAGLAFAKSRQAWITAQQRPAARLVDGQAIGKAHRLKFVTADGQAKVTGRLSGSVIIIKYPAGI